MKKKKVFLAGAVFKIGDTYIVEEMCMQMTLDDWLGKGTVTVKLNKPNNDEVEITIFRKYGSFLYILMMNDTLFILVFFR